MNSNCQHHTTGVAGAVNSNATGAFNEPRRGELRSVLYSQPDFARLSVTFKADGKRGNFHSLTGAQGEEDFGKVTGARLVKHEA